MIVEILLAAFITLVGVDFLVRVIRYAKTGKGKGDDFRLVWWKENN